MSSADFNNLCGRHPEIQRAFSVMQANHIRILLNLLVDASLLRLPGRVVRTIQRLLVSTGQAGCRRPALHRMFPRGTGAFCCRLPTEHQHRTEKLEQAGIIRSAYGKIYILDPTALNDSSDKLTSY